MQVLAIHGPFTSSVADPGSDPVDLSRAEAGLCTCLLCSSLGQGLLVVLIREGTLKRDPNLENHPALQ